MKLKNYNWNGFGFPIIFSEISAIKIRGELVPDVNWDEIAKVVTVYICADQDVPLSGNQVKFLRLHLDMSLRNFAKFIGVKHQSVMRWEKKAKASADIDAHTEIVLRIKILKKIGSKIKDLNHATDKVNDVDELKASGYKNFKPLKIPNDILHP